VDFAISKWCKKFINAMDSENRRAGKLQKLFCGWRSYQAVVSKNRHTAMAFVTGESEMIK
jgi:hypothetical protein